MYSTKENLCSTEDMSSQDTDDFEIPRQCQDHDESFSFEASPFISKKETSSLTAEGITPENEGSDLICPKSPSKKINELRLYPVKSRKKLSLDVLMPLNAFSEKGNLSKLEEECIPPISPDRDAILINKSRDCNYENGKDEDARVQSQMQDTNTDRLPVRECVLQTPDMGQMSLLQSSTFSASRKSENVTSWGIKSNMLLGSTISGISSLHYSSSDAKSEGSHSKSANPASSSDDVILTSTPRQTDKVFDWEEISNVTDGDGLSDCSSLRPFRKNSKFTYSSDFPLSDFSQESCASSGSNGEKEVFLNSSQELSGSDKENIEPNGNRFDKMKRMNHSPSSPYIKPKPLGNVGRQLSSQPVASKRRRHQSFEDVRHSLSQPLPVGNREGLCSEKRIKVDAGLDCDESDEILS